MQVIFDIISREFLLINCQKNNFIKVSTEAQKIISIFCTIFLISIFLFVSPFTCTFLQFSTYFTLFSIFTFLAIVRRIIPPHCLYYCFNSISEQDTICYLNAPACSPSTEEGRFSSLPETENIYNTSKNPKER